MSELTQEGLTKTKQEHLNVNIHGHTGPLSGEPNTLCICLHIGYSLTSYKTDWDAERMK